MKAANLEIVTELIGRMRRARHDLQALNLNAAPKFSVELALGWRLDEENNGKEAEALRGAIAAYLRREIEVCSHMLNELGVEP
jgi:hypothetical protein